MRKLRCGTIIESVGVSRLTVDGNLDSVSPGADLDVSSPELVLDRWRLIRRDASFMPIPLAGSHYRKHVLRWAIDEGIVPETSSMPGRMPIRQKEQRAWLETLTHEACSRYARQEGRDGVWLDPVGMKGTLFGESRHRWLTLAPGEEYGQAPDVVYLEKHARCWDCLHLEPGHGMDRLPVAVADLVVDLSDDVLQDMGDVSIDEAVAADVDPDVLRSGRHRWIDAVKLGIAMDRACVTVTARSRR